MILLALALAAQSAEGAASEEDFFLVASIVVRNDEITNRELRIANAYASCMARPYFALPAEFVEKQKRCRSKHVPKKPGAKLASVLDHLDHIVTENGGSEASLEVARSETPKP